MPHARATTPESPSTSMCAWHDARARDGVSERARFRARGETGKKRALGSRLVREHCVAAHREQLAADAAAHGRGEPVEQARALLVRRARGADRVEPFEPEARGRAGAGASASSPTERVLARAARTRGRPRRRAPRRSRAPGEGRRTRGGKGSASFPTRARPLALSPARDEKPRVRERARASAHRDDAADAGRELAQAREEHARGREAPRVDVGREHVEPHAQAQLA